MSFDPYLHFQGNASDALQFYAEIFGVPDSGVFRMRYADVPPDQGGLAGEGGEKLMHGSVTIDGRTLMMSDFPPGTEGDPQQAVSVSHTAATRAKAEEIFDRLADGGETIMPFGDTFWADGFGMVKDRFGTHWMVGGPPVPMAGMPG